MAGLQYRKGHKLNPIVEKTKTLFPRINFPTHHIFMKALFRYYSTRGVDITRADIVKLSQLMGDDFVSLVNLVENIEEDDNSSKFLNLCLKIKISAKKLNGNELFSDKNISEIDQAINAFSDVFQREKLELEDQKERLKALKNKKATEKMKEVFRSIEKEKLRFSDFPEFEIKGIKIGSHAAKILIRLQRGAANEREFLWLDEKGFNNEEVTRAFYSNRAKNHLSCWKKSNTPWSLVNAIADYRRSKYPQEVLGIIESSYPFKFAKGNKKLNSALLTTSGGVYRDLCQYETSLKFGSEANILTPSDFRPCTLLGASNMLFGNISEGFEWYQKAVELGFEPENYDHEFRAVYMRCNQQIQKELKDELLAKGYGFAWLTS
tara:strand:+ start:1004 stop:2137 length:1134 start_codon:yes stop_codon:yes gene_type:complete